MFFDAWGKKLFSFKKGDTEYGMGWLPLGGYVKISGMIDESMDKEQMKLPPKPYEFRSKPAWQRLIIMLGGVIVNFILGILIYTMIVYVWGEQMVKPEGVKLGFEVSETFKAYGFQDGDKIMKINGEVPSNVLEVNKTLFLRTVNTISVKHENGVEETIDLPEDIGKIMWEKGILFPFRERAYAVIDTVIAGSPAERAGIKSGDKVVKANGQPVTYWSDFTKHIDSTSVNLVLERSGVDSPTTLVTIDVTPEKLQKDAKKHQLGVHNYGLANLDVETYNYSFFESVKRGHHLGLEKLKDFVLQFKYVFTKKGASELGGFIAIGKIFPSKWNWQSFWSITAFLSIMLGFMNLLPIPALDGGHALFVLFEMVTGRKPSDKFLEYAQIVGFVILMALLLYANGNDIYKLIKGFL